MVQSLYKSKVILPKMEAVIDEFHDKLSRRDLASKIGVNVSTLKYYLIKNNFPLRRECRKEVPFSDQKISLVISGIRRKNYTKALKAATEAVRIYKK